MIQINSSTNGFTVVGVNNKLFPDNGTLAFGQNQVVLSVDESNIATFRSAANYDVLFSGLISQITIDGQSVTKQNIAEKFDAIANTSGGGDMSDYYTKEEVNELIPTEVSELQNDAGYITQEEVIINQSFPSGWHTTGTMADLIDDINADSDALVGKAYMGTVEFSDLPDGLLQAELQVEIMSEMQGLGKVLVFTVTSSNQPPYHWEYTSAYGASGTWRSWANSSDLANYYTKTESDNRYVQPSSLATVATSGDYDDLSNKPIIPDISGKADKSEAVSSFNIGAAMDGGSIVQYSYASNTSNYRQMFTVGQINGTNIIGNLNNFQLATPNDIANFFDGAEYDSQTKRINFKHSNTVIAYIDATAFIKDGMVDTVAISNGNLVITFNTDAGKQPISIPLTDIFNPANYYDKTAADAKFATKTELDTKEEVISTALNDLETNKADSADLATVATSGDYDDLTNKPTIPDAVSGTNDGTNWTSLTIGSTTKAIPQGGGVAQIQSDWTQSDNTAVDYIKNKPDLSVYAESANLATVATSGSYTDLSNKPDLTVYATKADMDIKEEVISTALNLLETTKTDSADLATVATSGSYNDLSNKPTIPDVSGKADKVSGATNGDFAALDSNGNLTDSGSKASDFQATLVSGTNIKTINNESILGSGNITIQGGGGTQVQSDWSQSDSTAVDYIKNKPDLTDYVEIPVYNNKEICIANALTELHLEKADKSELPNMSNYYTKSEIDATIGNINTLLEAI